MSDGSWVLLSVLIGLVILSDVLKTLYAILAARILLLDGVVERGMCVSVRASIMTNKKIHMIRLSDGTKIQNDQFKNYGIEIRDQGRNMSCHQLLCMDESKEMHKSARYDCQDSGTLSSL